VLFRCVTRTAVLHSKDQHTHLVNLRLVGSDSLAAVEVTSVLLSFCCAAAVDWQVLCVDAASQGVTVRVTNSCSACNAASV
jgi:hypothetical protein